MARVRPTDTELIKKLRGFHKPYFTVADLEKVLDLKRESLYVTLNRLVKSGVLVRLAKNIYSLFTESVDIEKIANELYFPSYLSFEQVLSRYSILSQIPYTQTFATTRPTKKMTIAGVAVEYSHVKKDLFFGYTLKNGRYIAEKEKALLDQLYMVSMGKRSIDIAQLDLRDIDKSKLENYAKAFPNQIKPILNRVKRYVGTTPVTIEGEERIIWNKR
ncbi:MAG: type IV toxin-antitoxin system AbiEi family antitoxin domain-containing protein [Patescibacteria group bacterium]